MPSITPNRLLKFLKTRGFYISRQSGSHMILHHKTDKTKRVTLPQHARNLKHGTLASVLKQAGLDKNELFKRN
jgi:mRNA interferase HicA